MFMIFLLLNIFVIISSISVSSSSSSASSKSNGPSPPPDPSIPTCGSVINKWVYNLDPLAARAPIATKYKATGYTYYLATCKDVSLCGGKLQPSMAAVCSTNSYNTLVTSKGLIWSMLDPKQPSAGIRMIAKTGPKCSLTTTRTRTLQVDFHCVPGKIATNFTINGAGDFCATNLIVMTKEACPTGGPFNPFGPSQRNGWLWATNIIILVLIFVYICGGCFYNIKYQEKTCGFGACPPHAKECPFYVADGCKFFCNCLIPILKKCLSRFCNMNFSSNPDSDGSSSSPFSKDEYPNATPAHDSLLNKEEYNSTGNESYGATNNNNNNTFKPIVNTRLDVDDDDNPFHGTNF